MAIVLPALAVDAAAQTLSNGTFNVQIGSNGEISSLQLTGDAFPTNYVMNATNAVGQNTADHEWVGELMFTYRLNGGTWTTALTNQSSDVAHDHDRHERDHGHLPELGQRQGRQELQGRRDLRAGRRLSLLEDHGHQHQHADAGDR